VPEPPEGPAPDSSRDTPSPEKASSETASPETASPETASHETVLGELLDAGFEIEIADDGKVRLHAKCLPADNPQVCADKLRFLVDALGVEVVPPPDPPT
jgi:hypothetical protein